MRNVFFVLITCIVRWRNGQLSLLRDVDVQEHHLNLLHEDMEDAVTRHPCEIDLQARLSTHAILTNHSLTTAP